MNFTTDQRNVIDARDCNILVSAAAGSGKTAVLVQRILELVCGGIDIDRLLVVTFTKAAAGEMRERITNALAGALAKDPENEHLQKQTTLIHNARITTIDSFCNFILHNNFNEIGLDPAFKTATDDDVTPLYEDILQEFLEEKYEAGDEDFLLAVESFDQSGDDGGLAGFIRQLYRFAENDPFPEDWLSEQIAFCEKPLTPEEFDESTWGKYALVEFKRRIAAAKELFVDALEVCEESDGPNRYAPMLEADLELIERLEECTTFFQYGAILVPNKFAVLGRKALNIENPEKVEQVKALREDGKSILKEIAKSFFSGTKENFISDVNRGIFLTATLAKLTLEFMKRFNAAKRDENMLTFSDVAHLALSVLVTKDEDGNPVPTPVAEDYRNFFKEIMIDEYQDSNLVQELLLSSISGECAPEDTRYYNRFMVGDVKQSIYRFRQARPSLFTEKYNTYTRNEGNLRKIILQQNFRSRDVILRDINHIFEKIMHKNLGNVEYDAEAELNPGATYPSYEDAGTEVLLLRNNPEAKETSHEQEAYLIAERISDLVRTYQVYDKEADVMRPARYSDIVILSRDDAGWFADLKEVLKKYGIPSYSVSGKGYFTSEEIRILMNYIRILDNPLQDVPLFGVLHSHIGGFNDEELALLKAREKDSSLYQCLVKCAEEEDALALKCRDFLAFVNRYRKDATHMPIRRLLQKLLKETDYRNEQAAFPDGEQRIANIDMLLERAGDFEKNGAFGLFSFIRYMDRQTKFDLDTGSANITDEKANVVRMMTIHKSKGLEFPICILSHMGKKFNKMDKNGVFLLDEDLGIACDAIYPEKRVRRMTVMHNLVKEKIGWELLGEELRLLYVALTRAKEKLIMTACVSEPENEIKKQSCMLNFGGDTVYYAHLSKAQNYLDFVLPTWNNVQIVEQEEIRKNTMDEAIDLALKKETLLHRAQTDFDEKQAKIWQERFDYQYPHQNLAGLYTKTTVSELKIDKIREENEGVLSLFDSESKDAYVPRFAKEKEEQSGSAYGSMMHHVMEKLDFCEKNAEIAVNTAWEEAEKGQKVSFDGTVYIKKVMSFMQTDLAARMQEAAGKGKLFKEKPFMLGLPASKVQETFPSSEVVLIQGIIDAYWEEPDGLVVLDYKTDRIGDLQELVMRYETQLDYYGQALSQITGKPVKEKILYSFSLQDSIVI